MSRAATLFDNAALRSGLKGKTARGAGVTIATQGAMFATQFFGTIWLARLLTPDDFGLIGMVVAVTGFMDTFKDLGLSAATVREKEISPAQVSLLFWFNVAISLSLAIICCALAPGLAWFYGRSELIGITLATAVGFVLAGLYGQQHALLRRNMRFVSIAKVEICAAFVGLGAGLLAAFSGFGYWSLIIQRLARGLTASTGYWLSTGWIPDRFRWDPSVKPMLRFGGFLAINNVMSYASRNVDNIAIGQVWGAASLGIYTRAYNLLMLPMSQMGPPIANVIMPALSRLRDEPEKFRRSFVSLLRVVGLVIIPLVAMLLACPDAVISILLGDKWLPAAEIFRWLGVAALVQPMTTICGQLFIVQGCSKEMSKCTLINSILAVVAILVAVPWGPAAVAGSYAISGVLIRSPIFIYYAGQISSVTIRDIYAATLPSLALGLAVFSVATSVPYFLQVQSPPIKILIAFFCSVGIVAIAIMSIPQNRNTFTETIGMFRLMTKGKVEKG